MSLEPENQAGETPPDMVEKPDGTPLLTDGSETTRPRRDEEMGFFDHLEELRGRVIKSILALVLSAIACGVFYERLWDILLAPAYATTPPTEFINIVVFGQITLTIQVALLCGLIVAIPFIIWQLWAFIKPGLYEREQKYVGLISFATILCFMLGVCFAYFVMIPTALEFAQAFQANIAIDNQFTIESYFSFTLGLVLAAGSVFEMPVLSWALSRFGVLTPELMKKYRRHAVIVLLIIAAIVTPTPDPINQSILAGPLYILYEISIIVSRFASRQRNEAMNVE